MSQNAVKAHTRLGACLIVLALVAAACGGGNDPDARSSATSSTATPETSSSSTTSSTTTTAATSSSTTTTSTTSTSTTLAPGPTIVVTEGMEGFPAYAGDGFTYYYGEDPDPEQLGCEGFPEIRLWVQVDGSDIAELLTEIPGAGTVYAGPNGRILIADGCEGFLGTIYHADVVAGGRLANVRELILPIDAASQFAWVDDHTVVALVGAYDAIWGDDAAGLRNATIDLRVEDWLTITAPGEPPIVGQVTGCDASAGLSVSATDPEYGEVTIADGVLSYLGRTIPFDVFDDSVQDFWYGAGTSDGKQVTAIMAAPNCG